MDKLNHYLKNWNLSRPIQIASTVTSLIYKVDYKGTPAALKLLTPLGQKHEARSGYVLKCLDGRGSVKIFNFDKNALLLEYINGPNLILLVENNKDTAATEIICDVLDILHSYSSAMPKNTMSLQAQFKSLFDRAKLKDTPEIYIRTAKVATELIESENNKVLLHGDLHHANILKTKDRGWVAIDPQAIYGERTYDVANSFFNPNKMPNFIENKKRIKTMATIFAKRLYVDENRVLKFAYAHGGLSASWHIDAGEDADQRLRVTRLIEMLL